MYWVDGKEDAYSSAIFAIRNKSIFGLVIQTSGISTAGIVCGEFEDDKGLVF